MNEESMKKTLIAAILVAAVLVSGTLVFLGLRLGGSVSPDELKTQIRFGIEDFVKDQEEAYRKAQEEAQESKLKNGDFVEGDFTDDDAVLGDKDAPVTIVEFSEYQCPFCEGFYSNAYQDIKKNYVDTGKVKIIFRDFPLDFHKGAYPAALTAECVREQGGDEMYFEMHNKIFENQNLLSGDVDSVKESLADLADEVGVDMSKYNECVANDTYKDEIYADQADAQSVGIEGTPSFLVNGIFLKGEQPYAAFEKVIEEALAE